MRNVAFALACLLLLACGKDDIIGQEEDIPETAVAGDDTAGSHIKTDNDEDNVAKTVFDRTVKVTFSGGSATVSGGSGCNLSTYTGGGHRPEYHPEDQ